MVSICNFEDNNLMSLVNLILNNLGPPSDSLVGRCPFVGDTDRATLLMVGEGTLNWDTPDVNGRSSEAKKFLRMLLQPDPE